MTASSLTTVSPFPRFRRTALPMNERDGPRRVLIIGAGGGPANNLIRSLKLGDPSVFVAGCHANRFALKQSPADRNYLVPPTARPDFLKSLCRVIESERIGLVVPNTDADVSAVSRLRAAIPCRVFLPSDDMIEICQDKYRLTTFLRARGVPAPLTFGVTDVDTTEELFDRLGRPELAWCRIRRGQGSMGAILVKSPEQVRSWVAYWSEMRGVPPTAFTLSEFLPGRDFAAQALWSRGELVLLKMYERLSHLGAASQPNGISSIAALSRTVFDPRAAEACERAVRALDPGASGVFCFDLKENADGVPCLTEINAGRFGMSTPIFDLPGKHNMAANYVRLAFGDPVDIPEKYDVAEDYYLVRDLDVVPGVYHADDLFEGIVDARS